MYPVEFLRLFAYLLPFDAAKVGHTPSTNEHVDVYCERGAWLYWKRLQQSPTGTAATGPVVSTSRAKKPAGSGSSARTNRKTGVFPPSNMQKAEIEAEVAKNRADKNRADKLEALIKGRSGDLEALKNNNGESPGFRKGSTSKTPGPVNNAEYVDEILLRATINANFIDKAKTVITGRGLQ